MRKVKKNCRTSVGLCVGCFVISGLVTAQAADVKLLKVNRNGRLMSVNLPVSSNVPRVEVRLFSHANHTIIEYSDVSPFAPKSRRTQTGEVFDVDWGKKEEKDRLSNRELRFPVVDVVIKPGMEAVIEIDFNGPGEYCFNGNFWPKMHPIGKEIRIPAEHLEHWENALLLDPKSNTIRSFYIVAKADVADSHARFDFETLRDDWTGSISVHDSATGDLIANATVSRDIDVSKVSTGSGVSRQRMLDSLSWATKYILDCKNTKPDSPTFGGLFLLYDLAAKTRLRSDWPWSWGPSAQMLLRVSEIQGIDVGMTSDQLIKAAVDIGEATLRQQILDTTHPAYGLIKTTIEPGTTRAHGFDNRASTADTLHLVGWGWMPLYKATKDRRFLEAAEKVADVAERLMDQNAGGMIPQAYDLKKKTWDDNMFFETSMGMKGLAALYLETGQDRHRKIMIRFVDTLLNAFEREDGLWEATLYGQTGKVSSCNFFTKSFGYCAEGLLAVHKAAPDRGYLKRAKKITEHVLNAQAPDGSWSVRLDRSAEEVGVTDKGTALWAYLFMRLYKTTGDKKYLTAGTKALEWCMDNQYFGDDTVARGGIVGRSWPSGIIYRHWFDMVTTYTVSFFGNALAEALSLDEWKVAETATIAHPVISDKGIFIKDQESPAMWSIE